ESVGGRTEKAAAAGKDLQDTPYGGNGRTRGIGAAPTSRCSHQFFGNVRKREAVRDVLGHRVASYCWTRSKTSNTVPASRRTTRVGNALQSHGKGVETR